MQHRTGEERREFQRLRLDPPIAGSYGAAPVTVVELGVLGARIRHDRSLALTPGELRFESDRNDVTMRCEIVRSIDSEGAFVSGVRFLAAVGDSGDHLRQILARLVVSVFENRSDSSGTRLHIRAVDGDRTVRSSDAQFLSYRLEGGAWRRRHVFLPEQPVIGFTVARGEDAQEMQRLCEVYEASDEEGRRLIRLFAELSVSDALQIPPQS